MPIQHMLLKCNIQIVKCIGTLKCNMQETVNKKLETVDEEDETRDMFDILGSEYSVDELDIRDNPNGFVLAQSPEGKTVEVRREFGELIAEEVSSHEVDFESRSEVEDVFGDAVMAE